MTGETRAEVEKGWHPVLDSDESVRRAAGEAIELGWTCRCGLGPGESTLRPDHSFVTAEAAAPAGPPPRFLIVDPTLHPRRATHGPEVVRTAFSTVPAPGRGEAL